MHIHILGICGTFMGGIAAVAREAGHHVTGCDANVYPPMSDQLGALGIDVIEGFSADQLTLRPDLWLVGNVVSRGNPLMEAILDAGLEYVSGPQWLAENVLRSQWVLAVAGTHGKTTTASLLAWILEAAGLQPGFLIGGVASNFPVSARLGGRRFFVIEADEYDTAFFDKRSKFVHYRPRTAVLNNLEFDHADIFPDLAAIELQFHHLVRTVPRSGKVIYEATQPSLQRVLARGCWSETEALGTADGWRAERVVEGAHDTEFMLAHGTRPIGVCNLPLAGAHNRANAIAAVVAAAHVGVDFPTALAALTRFAGVKRRLEVRGQQRGVTVLDDFAHHPTAIQATIAGLRARMEAATNLPADAIGSSVSSASSGGIGSPHQARLLAVVEPRSNTMKLGTMKALLPDSLAGADLVFCHGGGLGWDASQVLAPLGARARTFNDLEDLVQAVAAEAREGDQVLVMSNGAFGGVHGRLLEALGAPDGGNAPAATAGGSAAAEAANGPRGSVAAASAAAEGKVVASTDSLGAAH